MFLLLPGWQQRRLLTSARAFAARGDHASALLASRQAHQQQPEKVEPVELLADTSSRLGSVDEIAWKQALVTLEPGKAERRLDLVYAAMRHGEHFIAQEALAAFPEQNRETVAYHSVTAKVAIDTGDLRLAERHFEAVLHLEPGNDETKHSLASIRLSAPDSRMRAEARKVLEEMASQPEFRLRSLRALIADARSLGDTNRTLSFAQQLWDCEGARLDDRLIAFSELRSQYSKEVLGGRLGRLKLEAAQDPAAAHVLLLWLNTHGMAEESRKWAGELPTTLQAAALVRFALAQTALLLNDLPWMEELVSSGDWRGFEFLQFALSARLHRVDETQNAKSAELWQKSLQAASQNPKQLIPLGNLVEGWRWMPEAEQVWSLLSKGAGPRLLALKRLHRIFLRQGSTAKLYDVSTRIAALRPNDAVTTNNRVQLGLLLQPDSSELHAVADKNASQAPKHPAVISTWAFSLYLRGNHKEALDAMLQLPEVYLKDPQFAGYHGLLMLAEGQTEAAQPFLKLALDKGKLLPEERTMFERALQR